MTTHFYIKSKDLTITKDFIRINLHSAKFLSNPTKIGNSYSITIISTVEDGNMLNEFLCKLDEKKVEDKKIPLLQKIINFFK